MDHPCPDIHEDMDRVIAEMKTTKGIDVTGAGAPISDTSPTKAQPDDSPTKKRRVGASPSDFKLINAADITHEIARRLLLVSTNGKKGKLNLCICNNNDI